MRNHWLNITWSIHHRNDFKEIIIKETSLSLYIWTINIAQFESSWLCWTNIIEILNRATVESAISLSVMWKWMAVNSTISICVHQQMIKTTWFHIDRIITLEAREWISTRDIPEIQTANEMSTFWQVPWKLDIVIMRVNLKIGYIQVISCHIPSDHRRILKQSFWQWQKLYAWVLMESEHLIISLLICSMVAVITLNYVRTYWQIINFLSFEIEAREYLVRKLLDERIILCKSVMICQ